jgi:hypothetical protein
MHTNRSAQRVQRMSQEIKTVLIAISATLAALVVHHSLEQAQASARPVVWSAPQDPIDAIPLFE